MSDGTRLLAVIPARGGSKGLPGKNIRPFAGLPLIAHSVLFANTCPEITRCIVSTDSPEIADVAIRYDADVPFLRPPELAQDDTPLWPVLRHALESVEQQEGLAYDMLLLLDPTSPAREPADITVAFSRLQEHPAADGIVSVSQPYFNPISHCVIEKDGLMEDLIDWGTEYDRRQESPPVYRINGCIYIWRAGFVKAQPVSWRHTGKYLLYEIPEDRAMSIDTARQFDLADILISNDFISLPWMSNRPA